MQRASLKEKLAAYKAQVSGQIGLILKKRKGRRKRCNSHKVNEISEDVPLLSKKVPIDLAGISGYNGIEVIYLLGMAFAFPPYKKEVYG